MGEVGRRPLSRRRILEAAVELVDREGLRGLSMRRLGRDLGVEAMSLYNHVPNKEALLGGMVEVLIEEMQIPGESSAGWEEQVRGAFRSYLNIARAHPEVFQLFATRPLGTGEALRIFEVLRGAGLDVVPALHAFRALSSYTIGYALAEIRGFPLELEGGPRALELAPPLKEVDRDAKFDYGLDLIISGLRQKLDRQGAKGDSQRRSKRGPDHR
ncbi:MAG: TetR/AcrR family transcriptional regulator C-terminal domain-containing protein [Actinomycetota bacterium]|nr:TetR/AcrR family transcriptional regulator C-terminal domain-containing protein [Actinomycetota bacterium]